MGILRRYALFIEAVSTAVEAFSFPPARSPVMCVVNGRRGLKRYLWRFERTRKSRNSHAPPRFRRDYPLNLSISVSGGKESNSDSLSSGERNGTSPAHNLPGYQACGEMLRQGNGR